MAVTERADDSAEQTDKPDDQCPTCGVPIVQDGLLCPTCYLQGQAQAPPDGYRTFVRHEDGTAETRPIRLTDHKYSRPPKGDDKELDWEVLTDEPS